MYGGSGGARDQTALIPVLLVLFGAVMYYYFFKMPLNYKDFASYNKVKAYFISNSKYLLPEARNKYYDIIASQEKKIQAKQSRFAIFWSEFLLGYYYMALPSTKFLKYSVSYGELFILFVLLSLGGVQAISIRLRRKKRKRLKKKKIPRKYLPVKVRAVKKEQDKKYLEAIDNIYSLLSSKPCPASIYYHAPYKWGLLYHSIRVAKRTVRLLIDTRKKEGSKVTIGEVLFAFMVGLAHDLGKLEVYYYDDDKDKAKRGWKTKRIPIVPHTKKLFTQAARGILSDREIQSINKIFDEKPVHITKLHYQFRKLVKEADTQVTGEEMFQIREPKVLIKSFKDALWNLNINAILSADADGFYIPEKHVVIIMTGKLAKEVTNDMVSKLGGRAREFGAGERGTKKVHPILPPLTRVLAKEGWLYTEFDGVKGDTFVSYDVVIDKVEFKSVLLVRSDRIPRELRKRWLSEFAYRVEAFTVKSRIPEVFDEEQEIEAEIKDAGKEIQQELESSEVAIESNEQEVPGEKQEPEQGKETPENVGSSDGSEIQRSQEEQAEDKQHTSDKSTNRGEEKESASQEGDEISKVIEESINLLFAEEKRKPKRKG